MKSCLNCGPCPGHELFVWPPKSDRVGWRITYICHRCAESNPALLDRPPLEV